MLPRNYQVVVMQYEVRNVVCLNLRELYFSLVHSHLTYGNMVWGSAYKFKLKRLVQLQSPPPFKLNVCVIFANYHTMKVHVHLLHLRNL